MFNKIFLASLLLTGLFSYYNSYGQDTAVLVTYSLQQCVDIAIRNNPTVKQAELTMESNKIYWQQARSSMLPDISGGASRSIYNGKSINPYTNTYVTQQYTADNYNLNASIVLWHGSSIQNFIRQNSLAYEASREDWQQAKDQLTINVILDYLAVLNNQEQLKIAEQQVAVTGQQADRLNLLNQEGAIPPSDLYNIRGQLGSNRLTVLSTKNALETARLSLAQLMNIPYTSGMQIEPMGNDLLAGYSGTTDEIYQYALEHLALVKAASLHEESAQKGIKATRGQMMPTLSLSGGLFTNYSSAATTNQLINTTDEATKGYVLINNTRSPVYEPISSYNNIKVPYGDQWKNNFNSGVSLNLQVPLLNGLQTRSRLKLAKINEQQTAFQQNTVKIQLRQAIEKDYLSMVTAYETYKNLMAQVQDYTESFREAKVKFEAGSLNSVEFVLVQNNMDQARLNLIAAKYNYILQTKILDYYQGKLSFTSGSN